MHERQTARAVKIWYSQALGVDDLSALSRAGQAWERMEGELAEKIFSGGTGPGGAWWGQQASSAIPVAQGHCSSGKHQRPDALLFSPYHGPLHNSLFLASPQTPCLPLPWESTMESFSALSPRVTWQLSLSDPPTSALPQHSLAGPSFLE